MEMAASVGVVSRFLDLFVRKPQFDCVTRDVSVQGMRLCSEQPIPDGALLNVWVALPDDETSRALRLRGRVCWAAAGSVAGEFLAGIRLDAHPETAMAVWTDRIRDRIRERFRSVVPSGVTS